MPKDEIRVAITGAFLCFILAELVGTFAHVAIAVLYCLMFAALMWAVRRWWDLCTTNYSDSAAAPRKYSGS